MGGDTYGDAADMVRQAANGKEAGIGPKDVIAAIEALDDSTSASASGGDVGGSSNRGRCVLRGDVEGTHELVFSSALAGVPLLEGYMPTREVMSFSFGTGGLMQLEVETLPFLPSIQIVGEDCTFNDHTATISYRIRGKSETSTWRVVYADGEVLAAVSSVTGLNIARRVRTTPDGA
mmetsp:Transcript_122349/g.307681  ORF Transcript_122349/g.307681 Transcript_122349/m.307681 type:complete len:177 (-) Transcript_122349:122-652(-)